MNSPFLELVPRRSPSSRRELALGNLVQLEVLFRLIFAIFAIFSSAMLTRHQRHTLGQQALDLRDALLANSVALAAGTTPKI
jgi:hypothetical protein